jgi:hypothetical protein
MPEPIIAERLAELRADAMTLRMRVGPPVPEEMWDELARMAEEAGYNADSIRRRQRDFMSLTHATIGAAFQVGWRQGTAGVPELLAEVERLRGELTRFEGNAEILSASTVGEAFDRIEQTIRERDEARAELAKAREAGETHKTTADVMTLAVKRRNEETNALRARMRYVADSVAGGPDRSSLIADQIRAAVDGKHARIEDLEGVARCLLCRAEWPCGNQPVPADEEAASTVPAEDPQQREAWPLSVICPSCAAPPRVWCAPPPYVAYQVGTVCRERREEAARAGPCGSCGGTRWVDDENWQPEDHERAQGRVIGSGRIPCGICNHGGWNVPDDAQSKEADRG